MTVILFLNLLNQRNPPRCEAMTCSTKESINKEAISSRNKTTHKKKNHQKHTKEMATEVVLGVLIGGAGIWKLMSTFSGGSSSETVVAETSGIGKGWIMLICIVIMGCMILSINAEQIRRKAEEQAPAFVIAGAILFLVYILYLKGSF